MKKEQIKPINLWWMKPLRSYRFRSQIILFFSITSLTLLLISFLFTYIQKLTIVSILSDSAARSFIITTNFSLYGSQNQFKTLLDHRWNFQTQDLLQHQKIYLLVEKNQFTGTSKTKVKPYLTEPLPKFFTEFSDNFYYSMECYSSYGNQIQQGNLSTTIDSTTINPLNEQVIRKLDQIYPLISSNHKLFDARVRTVAFSEKEQTLGRYPCKVTNISGYHPHERIWYSNMVSLFHQNYNKSHQPDNFYIYFKISKPYYNYAYRQLDIAFTMNLVNLQNEFRGVLSSSMFQGDQENIFGDIESSSSTILVGNNAELLISSLLYTQQSKEIIYLYNQSITGYNIDDWQQILNIFNQNITLESDCTTQGFFYNKRILCRVNKTSGQDNFILAKKIEDVDGIVISFYNVMNVLKQNENEQIFIENTINNQTNLNIFICSATFLFILIFVTFLIAWILRPLEKIITFSNTHVQRQNPQKFKSFSNRVKFMDLKNEGPFQKLFTSVQNLTFLSNTDQDEIKYLNSLNYPKKIHQDKLQISAYLNKIDNLNIFKAFPKQNLGKKIFAINRNQNSYSNQNERLLLKKLKKLFYVFYHLLNYQRDQKQKEQSNYVITPIDETGIYQRYAKR